ncbi:ESF1 homolog [Watersipora subatra]|uniref:ESF1 homolog n=1 Tax=Watersipora subatra TaxID=2589382 RepID=UPI00355BE4BD
MLENLRQYQLNRLKYYYAIAEFDSPETAAHIYDQCDSREYLASCTQLDLRFVPEGMEFNEDELKESANHVPDNYEPKFFINPALGQSLVRCTWDENGPDRSGVLNKKYQADDLEQLDMDDYLASDSDKEEETGKPRAKAKERSELLELADSSSGEEDERSIDKYRALLLGGFKTTREDSDGSVDLEVTWDTGLKDTAEGLVKKKTKAEKAKGLESVFDKQRQRKREKAKQLKEQKKIKEMDVQAFSDDELPEGFNASELVASDEGIKEVRTSKHEKKKKRPKAKSEVLTHEATKEGEGESLNLMVMNDKGDTLSKKHFNMKEIAEYDNMTKSKRKRKLKRNELKDFEDDFKIDVKDERFRAMYSSHIYNIDPSSQDYRKTKAMQAIIDEKQRRIRDSERSIDKPKKRKIDPETSLMINSKNSESNNNISTLVKSIKAKSRLHSKKTRPLNGKG